MLQSSILVFTFSFFKFNIDSILLISIMLAYASFSGKQPEAYLFPKIITSVMIVLSSLSSIITPLFSNSFLKMSASL